MTTDLLRFLHILSAALWIGAALYWPGDLKRALEAGTPDLALRRARSALGLDLGAGVSTILTGGALAGVAGASVVTMWAGLAFALTRVVLLFALARPAVARAAAGAAAGDLPRARAAAKGANAYAGVAHLLWVLALAAMVFPV
jgi:hypothetical protein